MKALRGQELHQRKPHSKTPLPTGAALFPPKPSMNALGRRETKRPLHIYRKYGKFLSMAGLFNYWQGIGMRVFNQGQIAAMVLLVKLAQLSGANLSARAGGFSS